jgi:ABC-2 type transport system permease protein
MIFFKAVITIWRREVIRYWRDKTRIFSSLLQPLMFLAIFGTGLRGAMSGGNFGVDYLKFMYPGIIAMAVMGTAFFSTISTVWDREFGFLKEILVAPVSRTAIVVGKIFGATTISSFQGLIILILAPILGIQISIAVIIQLFLLMVLLAFSISGLGILVASLMKTTESFGFVMQILIMPMFFISGAFFPLTSVPKWLAYIARINPLTYGVDSIRQVILVSQTQADALKALVLYPVHLDVLFLLAISVFLISLATLAFNRRD